MSPQRGKDKPIQTSHKEDCEWKSVFLKAWGTQMKQIEGGNNTRREKDLVVRLDVTTRTGRKRFRGGGDEVCSYGAGRGGGHVSEEYVK